MFLTWIIVIIQLTQVQSDTNKNADNLRPVIGILAQGTDNKSLSLGDTFIPSTYVDYLQQAGARAVPIRVNEKDEYYETMFSSINGVLFPGGGVNISHSDFHTAALKLYNLAVKANDEGNYFPLWGTCQGFELMTVLTSGQNLLSPADAMDLQLPLYLKPGFEKTRMFSCIPPEIQQLVTRENVTANYHRFCLTPEVLKKNGNLSSFYRVISTNKDRKGVEFVSTMEAKKYPFYATQWHPEKNIFTWDVRKSVNHSAGAIKVAQYFADFFVDEARKNNQKFPNEECLSRALFYNYQPVYEGYPSFERNYYFNFTSRETEQASIFNLPNDPALRMEYIKPLNNFHCVIFITAVGFGVVSLALYLKKNSEASKSYVPLKNDEEKFQRLD